MTVGWGSEYMNNIFDRYYEKYDAWYDNNVFAYLSEIKALRKVLPKKGAGLEIGVGTGRFAAALGIKYGIDPSEKMLDIAEKRGITVKPGYGEKIPFGDSFFDYAAIIITLCFVNDPAGVLRDSARVLKKNGKIIIAIIDKNSFLGESYREGKRVFYKKARFFSVMEITGLLKRSGFGKITYYQTIFKFPKEMNSVENPIKGFGKGAFAVIGAVKQK
jgi:ubiquinone/menaquinone biosynthesis C-methylase UbiE